MPNSGPELPLLSEEASGLLWSAALPEPDLPGELDGAGLGLTGKGCPPDSARPRCRSVFGLALVVPMASIRTGY
jgi:hypothetical protein